MATSNLISIIKAAAINKQNKADTLLKAQKIVLNELLLTTKEIYDGDLKYGYLINERTGRPYDHIPVTLPRKVPKTVEVLNHKGKLTTDTEYVAPDDVLIVDDVEFSRERFYGNNHFIHAARELYGAKGYEIDFYKTRNGWLLKIYIK